MAGALREVMERNDVTNLEENLVSSQLLAEHCWPGPGIRYHAMVIETEANTTYTSLHFERATRLRSFVRSTHPKLRVQDANVSLVSLMTMKDS